MAEAVIQYKEKLDDLMHKKDKLKDAEKYSKKNACDDLTVLQGQVKGAQGVMKQNMSEAVNQYEGELDNLLHKTDELKDAPPIFQMTAPKIQKKDWWKNLKMKIIVGLVVFAVILGIVLAIVFGSGVLD